MSALLARIQALMQGEPLRVITYGAVVVVWVVLHVAFALNLIGTQPPNFDEVLAAVSAAVIVLNEIIRQFVSSPATVARLVGDGPGVTVAPAPTVPVVPAP